MSLILTTGKYKDYKTFITNRFLRLYPIYLVVAASTLVLSFLTNTAPYPQYREYAKNFDLFTWVYCIFSNLTIIAQDVALFMGLQDGHLYGMVDFTKGVPFVYGFLLIPQAWSLSVELMFYVIAPAFLWLGKAKKVIVLSLFIFLSIACKIWLLLGAFPYDPWAYRFFLSVLYLFLLGSLTHHVYDTYLVSLFEKVKARHVAYAVAAMPFIGFFCWMKDFSKADFTLRTLTNSLQKNLAVQGYDLIIKEIINATFPFVIASGLICVLFYVTSKSRLDRFIGELSYPIYVVHILVINILGIIMVRDSIFSFVTAGITILVSMGLVKYVQTPTERYRMSRLKTENTTFEVPPFEKMQDQKVCIA